MSKTNQNQRFLKMIESEERKDAKQVESIKKSYIEQFRNMKKEDMFPTPKKISIWKKIKILFLGN